MTTRNRTWVWLLVHLAISLAWIALLTTRACDGGERSLTAVQVATMLLLAGWLPSLALASWQVRLYRWRTLILSDLLGAGVLVLLACTAYLPLFVFNVVWFLPFALLPRGVLTALVVRLPCLQFRLAKEQVPIDQHDQTISRHHRSKP